MSAVSNEKTAYEQALEKLYSRKSNDVHSWLKQTRETAFERFHELKFPTKKNEAWKYANLKPLLDQAFVPAEKEKLSVEPVLMESHFLKEESHRFSFLNGIANSEFSSLNNLPSGVQLKSLSEAIQQKEVSEKELFSGLKNEWNPFAAINAFSFQDGVYLKVAKETVVDIPIHLLLAGVGVNEVIADYPRVVISIGSGSKVNLIMDSIGLTPAFRFTNTLMDLHLEQNARLNFVLLQREEEKSYQFFTARCRLEAGSFLDYVSYSRGGDILRNEVVVDFEGEGATADLRFLSVLSQKSKNYNHITVNHKVPNCTSRQLSKNVLADKAQAEFNSLVSVFPDAIKSNSDQLNRNLLLSDSARAYSRPQLKIDNDDVQCAHGSATGQFVGDELFYLRSRGIDKKLASFILSYSFADEVLDSIPFEEIRNSLENEVHHELDAILEQVEPESMGVV